MAPRGALWAFTWELRWVTFLELPAGRCPWLPLRLEAGSSSPSCEGGVHAGKPLFKLDTTVVPVKALSYHFWKPKPLGQ
jgi:hypothetical protein